jgi:DNA-binding XRE family transcriptional regulator
MSKRSSRPYARYTSEAVALLGNLIRKARIERKQTAAELAERAGVSRGLVQRIEHGDPGCAIGAVFEVAALVGVRLFDLDQQGLSANNQVVAQVLTLLPSAARSTRKAVKDDF